MIPKSIYSQYKQKKKRAVDPNAPPRPTLLGHEKEFKGFRGTLLDMQNLLQRQEEEIRRLRTKTLRLESDISQLSQVLKRR